MKLKPFILISIIILGLNVGCSKKALIRKYYILEIDQGQFSDSTKFEIPLPIHMEVQDFEVGKAFEHTPIVLRTNTNELNYYFYHHWAVKPGIAIADMVYTYITQQNLFQKASRGYTTNSDYCISGHVYTIERLEKDKKVYAHLHVKFDLLDHSLKKSLLQYEFDKEQQITKKKQMNPVAYQMSLILQQELDIFMDKVIDFVQSTEDKS